MDGRWLALLAVGAAAGAGAMRRTGSPVCLRTEGKGSRVRTGPRLCKASTRQRYDSEPELEQVLVLSTAHLSKFEAERLDRVFPERLVKAYRDVAAAEDKLETVLSFQTDYGWLVYAQADDGHYDAMARGPDQMPALARVLRFARDLGARWVRFDCDGPTIAGLDTFDW